MDTLLAMHRRGDMEGIWNRYCSFLDLSLTEFQSIQDRLLNEQLSTWKRSPLVRQVFGGEIPSTVDEFRERAPLTTYAAYADGLNDQNEEGLPEKPFLWVHTSGRSGQYAFKWIPFSKGMYDATSDYCIGAFILCASRRRGEVRLKERDRLMFTLAPLPFVSGLFMRALHEQFNFRMWPPYEQAVEMDYFERIREATRLAFSEGLDYFYGISSLMINLSEQFEQAGSAGGSPEMRKLLRKPKVLMRVLKGIVKAKLRGGALRPSDLWKLKGMFCGGMDASVYQERIREKWGGYPREAYGCTEFGFVANQHFGGPGLVPCVKSAYLEFLELDDYTRFKEDPTYRPRLKLLSEVDVGKEYVLVGTNLNGGVLVRYIVGDAVRFHSLSDDSIGLQLPRFEVSGRIDDIIDIAGFTRLTEKTIWNAVEGSGVPYFDWVAVKEYKNEEPLLHLYLETKADGHNPEATRQLIHEQLKELDPEYKDLEEMAGIRPLVLTMLSPGTFGRYQKERQAEGYDLAHLKPLHMNPKRDVVSRLLTMSEARI